jgi:transaldolase
MSKNNLLKIQKFGQSIWLDYIDRQMIQSGELKQLIEEDGLRGVTSNPSIFDKAIESSEAYEESIRALSREGKKVEEIYQDLTVKDVQMAADEFRRLHEASGGIHGFVSLEVNPHLAYRTEETIAEARELWRSLDRPNVFIKVPATKEGLPAIRQLIQGKDRPEVAWPGGYCQRQRGLSDLQGNLRPGKIPGVGPQGRSVSTSTLGQHQYEKP